jgi:cytochrome c553
MGRWGALLTALFISNAFAQERIKACAACHGPDGNSVTQGVPSLAAQPRVFLETQMVLTREGLRGGEVMQQLLRGVSDKEIVALADYYSRQPLTAPQGNPDAALFKQGRELSAKHRCGTCHLPDYRGQQQVPRLAGQREEYLFESLRGFRDNPRAGGDTIMTASVYGLKDAELKALAHYLARTP